MRKWVIKLGGFYYDVNGNWTLAQRRARKFLSREQAMFVKGLQPFARWSGRIVRLVGK